VVGTHPLEFPSILFLEQCRIMLERATKRVVRGIKKPFRMASEQLVGVITHVKTTQPVVALTFDDGPSPDYTPRLLDILHQYQAKATFFMVGRIASQYPELVQRIGQNGHAIGNHSWDHPSFPWISHQERSQQLEACERAIAPYGQKLFRPPFGDLNLATRLELFHKGYQIIIWDAVAYDWSNEDAPWFIHKLEQQLRPGSIVLLHDQLYRYSQADEPNREAILQALEHFLEKTSGTYRFVTVPELLKLGTVQRQLWFKRSDPDWLNELLTQTNIT
jgi:peptidoglycan-N-acetylglucosamine deacetylase